MSLIQIARSPDLQRLRDDGYNVHVTDANFLLVRDVPYVNSKREVLRGTLVSKLDLAVDVTVQPSDHTARLIGEIACNASGVEITRNTDQSIAVGDQLVAAYSYSRKPQRGHFVNYHEKMTAYVDYFGKFVAEHDTVISAKTGVIDEPESSDSPFLYPDTASSRAEINSITAKLAQEAVAIVGLGGTGSYVLDLVAKTPVKWIHLFDEDRMLTHNLFRAPGAPQDREKLRLQPRKVEYFNDIYSKFRKGIVDHPIHLKASNVSELKGMSFVFLCMEGGAEKRAIVEWLEAQGIPFVDVGMGLYSKREKIAGTLRVVLSKNGNREVVRERITFKADNVENEYDKNIQISDLNAMNACLAVMMWKKMCGFYADLGGESYLSFSIGTNLLAREDGVSSA